MKSITWKIEKGQKGKKERNRPDIIRKGRQLATNGSRSITLSPAHKGDSVGRGRAQGRGRRGGGERVTHQQGNRWF